MRGHSILVQVVVGSLMLTLVGLPALGITGSGIAVMIIMVPLLSRPLVLLKVVLFFPIFTFMPILLFIPMPILRASPLLVRITLPTMLFSTFTKTFSRISLASVATGKPSAFSYTVPLGSSPCSYHSSCVHSAIIDGSLCMYGWYVRISAMIIISMTWILIMWVL